ncbi:MAG: hypothetical protein FJZ01_20520 [Candidatus Sericytochromatia bacterium]|nr:hypothetical protein [Candidatus Tanganyikabacteria bacterium]
MKKALVLALVSAVIAGCGVSPTSSPARVGGNTAAPAVSLDNAAASKLQLRAKDARKPQPSWKKKLAERTISDMEKASYSDLLKAAFADAVKAQAVGLTEVSVDSMETGLKLADKTTFDALFIKGGKLGGLIEVIATDGKVTTYEWGFMQAFQYLQMKQLQGEPIMQIANPEQIQSLPELLTKAKMLPMPANVDSANAYLNMMPRRKPDLSVEWFPAYIVVTYAGHYAQGKMIANADTGDIYFPKP